MIETLAQQRTGSSDMIEIDLAKMGEAIAARKAAMGGLPAERAARARNKGLSRTPEKRALLAKLDSLAREAGRAPSCMRYY